MKIRLLIEEVPDPAVYLRILLLKPEIIMHGLPAGKLMPMYKAEPGKQILIQTDSVLHQVQPITEALHRQVVLQIIGQIHRLSDQADHILYILNHTGVQQVQIQGIISPLKECMLQPDNTEAATL